MDAQIGAASRREQLVEIILISPPAIPTTELVEVDIHFRPLHTDNLPSLRLLAGYESKMIAVIPIDPNDGVARMEFQGDTAGCIKFVVQSEDGTLASNESTIVVLPHDVAVEVNRVFDDSLCGLVEAAKDGMIVEESIGVAELEGSPILAKRAAWRHSFHRLVQDMGRILGHAKMRSTSPAAENKPFELSTTLSHVLVFLLDNHAYRVGDYILGQAMEAGETVTFNGMTLDRNEIDLEYLHQNMQRSPGQGGALGIDK
ncbi:hypothetical protein BSKO_03309 [Bryopsis sp. KO-2023]|nr:hypothetical protein BSKO_03309 [Bryopsis sp. KO-2023]